MDEKPKSIWKKSWTGWRGLLLGWSILMAVLLVCFFVFLMAAGTPVAKSGEEMRLFGAFGIVVTLIFLLATLARWLCSWRNFKRFLFGCACFATLIALLYVEEDWRGKHDWEKFKREWEAKGEHFDYASVIPPPVPADQNFALTPIVASSYEDVLDKNGKRVSPLNTNVVNRLAIDLDGNVGDWKNWPTNGYWLRQTITDLRGWQEFYRVLAAKTNLFAVPPQPQSPAADVLLALSKYDSIIDQLRRASELPYSRFPLNYDAEHPFATLLPHLPTLKRLSQVLQLRAIAELQAGEADKALADVKLSLRLIESIRTEPLLISELVRLAMFAIALQPIYEGLADHRWSEAQLVALDAELAKLDFLADYQSAMRGERAGGVAVIEHFRKLRNYKEFTGLLSDFSADDGSETLAKEAARSLYAAGFYLMPSGWFYQNELEASRIQQQWISIMVTSENHRLLTEKYLETDQSAIAWSQQPNRPWNSFAKLLLPALGRAAIHSARTQISVDLARTSIALERYRLAHGEYPESLDALVPQFVAKVPHDVIGGQPLKYRREANGQFILYSVGWNETDDGGVIGYRKGGTVPDFESGDWVWRYPKSEGKM